MKLERDYFSRDTVEVAKDLLGKKLVKIQNNKILSGYIVETEAYTFDQDPASHAYKGPTKRNKPMFGTVGFSYIYFIYGSYFCFNVIAKTKTTAAGAILIRAIEPDQGSDLMLQNRNVNKEQNLTNGPGKLCQAMGINKELNDVDLLNSKKIFLVDDNSTKLNNLDICKSKRIGISTGTDKMWRFYIKDNIFVSKHKVF